jgi:hypothetical protein
MKKIGLLLVLALMGCNEKDVTSAASSCTLNDVLHNGWTIASATAVGGSKYFSDISRCQVATCDSSHGVDSLHKLCTPLTVSCVLSNGTGQQNWQSGSYSACVAVSCDPGYIIDNGLCVVPPDIIAQDDTESVEQAQVLHFNAADLLANDSSTHGETLSVVSVQNPTGGTVSLSTGVITFTPSVQTGQAAYFFYTVQDTSLRQTTAQVNVTVTPLPTLYALVFDASDFSSMSTLLNATPPTMAQLFDDWGRFEEAKAGTYTPNAATVNSAQTVPGAISGHNYTMPQASRFYASKQDTLNYQLSTYGSSSVIQGLVGGFWTWFEGLSWSFDPLTSVIKSTVNSKNYIGFVSPDTFENYLLEATLSSTDTDDDTIALVIAYARDPITQATFTLSVARTQGGNTPVNGFGVMYNLNQSDAALISADVSVGGVNKNSSGGNGWASRYSRVQVKRNGDIIQVMCSSWNSLTLVPASLIEIDLNSDPRLAVFKGAHSYGFAAYSQQDSSFTDIAFSAGTNLNQSIIYDLADGKIYEYTNNQWVATASNLAQDLGYPREVYNPQTNKTYVIDAQGNITLRP